MYENVIQPKFEFTTSKTVAMTPTEILEKVQNDYDNRLFTFPSFEDLIRTIIKEDFPTDISQKIKLLLLKIFIDKLFYLDKEEKSKVDFIRKNTLSMTYCYYTIDNNSGNEKEKRSFRDNILTVFYSEQALASTPRYSGTAYLKWKKAWFDNSSENFLEYFGPDIPLWPDRIKRKFKEDIADAIRDDIFAEDRNDYNQGRIATEY